MKRIYAIPGLNTTKELFDFLKLENAEIITLKWPAPEKGETMQSYARKFSEKIDISQPFYLLGVSFGGMLCMELAKIVKPVKTFLISSSKSPKEFPPFFTIVKYLCLHLIPTEAMYMYFIPKSHRRIGFDELFLPQFIRMVHSMPPNYYRRSINCIINWKPGDATVENVVHLHGNADRLLPYKFVKCDYMIDGGTHAMVVYKAKQISEILDIELR